MAFAFVFESVGSGEWLVLLAVVLIVVGPKNLPAAARKVGSILSQLRRAADEFKRQLMTMDQEVRTAVDEVKKEYVDLPNDDSPAGETGAETAPDDMSTPSGDNAADGEDRANYDYGYDYGREYGYDDSGPVMGEDGLPQPGDVVSAESNSQEEKPADEDPAAPQ